MIIKITVKDNDFTQILERFATELFDRLYFGFEPKSDNIDEIVASYRAEKELQRLLNSNIKEKLSQDEKAVIKANVVTEWWKFVETLNKEEHTKEYLRKNFLVSISERFTERWENGESVYFFTMSQKWISQ